MSGAKKVLLSVDWDYFLPIPKGREWFLYDWSHKEAPFFYSSELWASRAYGFKAANKSRPYPDPKVVHGFWDKFRFSEDCKVYVADSHACIAQVWGLVECNIDTTGHTVPRIDYCPEFGVIHNFDAHHDCGYPNEQESSHYIYCSDWAMHAIDQGMRVYTWYPEWREVEDEPDPRRSMYREVFNPVPHGLPTTVIDRVFVCRSSDWMPPWCDPEFDELIQDLTAKIIQKVEYVQDLPDRSNFGEAFEAYVRGSERFYDAILRNEKEDNG